MFSLRDKTHSIALQQYLGSEFSLWLNRKTNSLPDADASIVHIYWPLMFEPSIAQPLKYKSRHHLENPGAGNEWNNWGWLRFHFSSKVRALERKKNPEILLLSAEQKHPLLPPSATTENTYLALLKCDRKDIFQLSDFISIKIKSVSGEGSDLNGPLKVCWLTWSCDYVKW